MVPTSCLNARIVSVVTMMERTTGLCHYASWRMLRLHWQHCLSTASSAWCTVQITFTCTANGCNKTMPIVRPTRYQPSMRIAWPKRSTRYLVRPNTQLIQRQF